MNDGAQAALTLDPQRLVGYSAPLYRLARGLCRSHHEAEDLVQETFARVLARPRRLGRGNELAYLARALRNTHIMGCRAAARRPLTVPILETNCGAPVEGHTDVGPRELMAAIAAAPERYRDAVVAIDVLGLSYEQAARRLLTRTATINSRLFRGREHVARTLAARAST